ncbi:MAG: Tol-Pal system beta propeller repeat protein TolB [Pseudomonadota bacterium]
MLKNIFALLAAVAAAIASPAAAQTVINITEGTLKPHPIAIPTFAGEGGSDEIAQQITEVVRNNLVSTGLFAVPAEEAYIQKDLDIQVQPRFADWRIINANDLVVGRTELLADGRLSVAFRLWDVYGEEVRRLEGQAGRQYVTTPDNWRRIAHKISDSIYTRLTGETGIFDSRIVYIAETGPPTARVKRLAIMDQDGANQQYLTSGDFTVLTPRFSTSDQEITYMSYEGGRPRVYLFNIQTGRQEVLGNFRGMTFAPRFAPDGRSVVMSQADRGNSELFSMDLSTRQTRQLSDHPAIDTSPSMSPDGRQIAFTSDRGGSPQIYVMNTNGAPLTCPSGGRDVACRITFGDGRYSTPVWSPRGDLIAFTKQSQGKFYIGVIGVDGKGERLLTGGDAYLDEGPSWSPNGRVIIFFRELRRGAGPTLWSVDLTGRNLRPLSTPTDASDPAWSPLLD